MALPENLYLFVGDDGGLLIHDAQECHWIEFAHPKTVAHRGDSFDWHLSVVKATCAGLGVTEAWTENGFETGIEGALTLAYEAAGISVDAWAE